MTNNSDGLSPSLRPQLGVGWKRALPSPFGFDNGINFDGVNDYVSLPTFANTPFSNVFSFEFWTRSLKYTSTSDMTGPGIWVETTGGFNVFFMCACVTAQYYINNVAVDDLSGAPVFNLTTLTHCVIASDGNRIYLHINGGSAQPGGLTYSQIITINNGLNITSVKLGIGHFYGSRYLNGLQDEFRYYNKVLSSAEMGLNYNNGIGNNPCVTENLKCWLKFESFETLDFSIIQDGSDLRLGIRDMSGKNNHGLPVNMDTNPASGTYVLKPF